MNETEVKFLLERALDRLVLDHSQLFRVDVNERSLTHWLAVIMMPHFEGWHVDCEYNRDGDRVKRVISSFDVEASALDAPTVYPDIIVHRRETDVNLLVVECKKNSSNARGKLTDGEKLDHYLALRSEGGYGYEYGALVEFEVDSDVPSAEIVDWRRRQLPTPCS